MNIKSLKKKIFNKKLQVSETCKFLSLDNRLFSVLVGLIFAGIFCTGFYVVSAYTWQPGQTNDPTTCTAGDLTCIAPPATYSFGNNNFTGAGNFSTTGTGTFGVVNVTAGGEYQYNGGRIITIDDNLNNYFFGLSGNKAMTGGLNVGLGLNTLENNTTGAWNTAVGTIVLEANTTGHWNTGIGKEVLVANISGNSNVAIGAGALLNNVSGNDNVAIGTNAGASSTGNYSTYIGGWADQESPYNFTNATAIGYHAKVGASNSMVLGGTGAYAVNVGIGTTTPDAKLDVENAVSTGGYSYTNWFKSGLASPASFHDYYAGGIGYAESDDYYGVRTSIGLGGIGNSTGSVGLAGVGLNGGSGGLFYGRLGLAALTGDIDNIGFDQILPVGNIGLAVANGDPAGYALVSIEGINYFAGNVGIGTTTPDNLLEVAGLIDFDDANYNTKLGYQAGMNVTSGAQYNNFVGYQTGLSSASASSSSADYNNAFGYRALYSNTTGFYNTAIGNSALSSNTIGGYNTAVGANTLILNTTGDFNSAFGITALSSNTSGNYNVAIGVDALQHNTTGGNNIAVGYDALNKNTTGSNNIAIGNYALLENITGSGNVALGNHAGRYETGDNAFYVDNQSRGSSANDKARALLYGTFDQDPVNQKLTINASVGIGTITPAYELDVVGDAGATRFCLSGDCIANWPSGSTSTSQWTTSGDDIYYIAGNVGIGTTSPDAKLTVDNGTVVTGGFDYTNSLKSGQYLNGPLGDLYTGAYGYASTTDDNNDVAGSVGLAGFADGTGSFGVAGIGVNGGMGGMFASIGGSIALVTSNIDPAGYSFISGLGLNLLAGQTTIGDTDLLSQLSSNVGFTLPYDFGVGGSSILTANISGSASYFEIIPGASMGIGNYIGADINSLSSNPMSMIVGNLLSIDARANDLSTGSLTAALVQAKTESNSTVGSLTGLNIGLNNNGPVVGNLIGISFANNIVGTIGGEVYGLNFEDLSAVTSTKNYLIYAQKNGGGAYLSVDAIGNVVAATGTFSGFQLTANPTPGYVLTADVSGNGTWQAPGATGWAASGTAIYNNNGTGSVGIGTSSPDNLFQVAGLIDFDNTDKNTKLGYQALSSNTTGTNNTAVGYQALYSNTNGFRNTAVGEESLYYNTTGQQNSAVGYMSLHYNTIGASNVAFGYYALSSNIIGVGNSAFGSGALWNSTGDNNTANGSNALYYNTTGGNNTAVGESALLSNTTGYNNTALGNSALRRNVVGIANIAVGYSALANTTGSYNIAVGVVALGDNTIGDYNIAIGANALHDNVTGSRNVALGSFAGYYETGSNTFYVDNRDRNNTAGDKTGALLYGTFDATPANQTLTVNGNLTVTNYIKFDDAGQNTKLGYQAGKNATSGAQYNTFVGYQAGLSNALLSTGAADFNSAFGYQSLYSNTTGYANTANGYYSLEANTTGQSNAAFGSEALRVNTTGIVNTAIGVGTLYSNTTGEYNTAIGSGSLSSNSTGSRNVALGYFAGYWETSSDNFYVDNQDRYTTAGDKAGALLYGTFNASGTYQMLTINAGSIYMPYLTGSSGSAVTIDSDGLLHATVSSLRYKHDIQPLTQDWSTILRVQPKSFKYNGSNDSDIGYIAEDFDSLGLTDLVLYNKQGQPNSIKYDRITLYNTEMLKQQQLEINTLKERLGITAENTIITPAGTSGDGAVSGVVISGFDQTVQLSLANFGATLSQGVLSLKQIIADKITAKTAKLNKIEMVDQSTGETYCTWIENGDWKKTKGDCTDVNVASVTTTPEIMPTTPPSTSEITPTPIPEITPAPVETPASVTPAALTPIPTPTPTPTLEPTPIIETTPGLNIISVSPISEINVAYGTALASANLPTTVAVELSDTSIKAITITWDNGIPSYDGNTAGTYVFSGTLAIAENITNTNNLNANINVTVGQQPPPPPEDPLTATTDIIQNTTSGLLNGAWNLLRWAVGTPIQKLFSLQIMQKTKASLSDSANILQIGLLSPIQNMWSSLFNK